jgi:hypothetical protein
MNILFFSDIHFKLLSSIPILNREKEGMTLELYRAVKSMKFVMDYIDKNYDDIDRVVFLGDAFHCLQSNSNLTTSVASFCFQNLCAICNEYDIPLILLSGNHDCVNEHYSMIFCLSANEHIIHDYNYLGFYYLPYIEPEVEMYHRFYSALRNDNIKYIFTHLSVNGFMLNKFKEIDNGVVITDDVKDKVIVSGHIHVPQKNGNIVCVGSLYQQNIIEKPLDIKHGICVLDTNTNEFEFVENTYVGKLDSLYLSNPDKLYEFEDENIDAVKVVIDVDDSDLLEDVKLELSSRGILYFTQRKLSNVVKKEYDIDVNISEKDIVDRFIKNNYPNLEKYLRKYMV